MRGKNCEERRLGKTGKKKKRKEKFSPLNARIKETETVRNEIPKSLGYFGSAIYFPLTSKYQIEPLGSWCCQKSQQEASLLDKVKELPNSPGASQPCIFSSIPLGMNDR